MQPLEGFHAKYLRGLGHGLKPLVFVGQKGLTPALIASVVEALEAHELVKVRFLGERPRRDRAELAAEMARRSESALAGLIGHTALLYRPHPDPAKRRITLPARRAPAAV